MAGQQPGVALGVASQASVGAYPAMQSSRRAYCGSDRNHGTGLATQQGVADAMGWADKKTSHLRPDLMNCARALDAKSSTTPVARTTRPWLSAVGRPSQSSRASDSSNTHTIRPPSRRCPWWWSPEPVRPSRVVGDNHCYVALAAMGRG